MASSSSSSSSFSFSLPSTLSSSFSSFTQTIINNTTDSIPHKSSSIPFPFSNSSSTSLIWVLLITGYFSNSFINYTADHHPEMNYTRDSSTLCFIGTVAQDES